MTTRRVRDPFSPHGAPRKVRRDIWHWFIPIEPIELDPREEAQDFSMDVLFDSAMLLLSKKAQDPFGGQKVSLISRNDMTSYHLPEAATKGNRSARYLGISVVGKITRFPKFCSDVAFSSNHECEDK